MRRLGRRQIAGLTVAGLLAGCGWRPVYAPSATGSAEEGLAATEVLLIGERNGQLLREALKSRFERGRAGVARRYDLSVSLTLNAEPIGIQRDNTSSRVRFMASAAWVLYSQSPQRATLASGRAQDMDAYNVLNQQYFAADLESEALQRRMMEALADQVTLQLATWFRQRDTAG